MQHVSRWRHQFGPGEGDFAVVGEFDDGLHRSLAERRRADDHGAVTILERGGDDLGRRGGLSVDQHQNRQAERQILAAGLVVVDAFGVTALGADDFPLGQQQVRDLDRLLQQPSWVAAQIEHQAPQSVGQPGPGIFQLLGHGPGRILVEALEPENKDAVVFGFEHRGQENVGPFHSHR